MSRSINDGDVVFACFKFPQGNINSNTTLTFSFQLVQDPGIFEGTFAHLWIKKKKIKIVLKAFSPPVIFLNNDLYLHLLQKDHSLAEEQSLRIVSGLILKSVAACKTSNKIHLALLVRDANCLLLFNLLTGQAS